MFNVMVDAKAQSTKLCSMEMGQEVKKKKKTFPSSPLSIDHIEENVTNSFLLPSLLVSETHSTSAGEAVDSVQHPSNQFPRHVPVSMLVTWKGSWLEFSGPKVPLS